jgi:NAD(P)-dependent dehydrogenase (short-subunit alcohol dehydrogenase family)
MPMTIPPLRESGGASSAAGCRRRYLSGVKQSRVVGPMRWCPDDVAALVAFLVSEEGEWINGQVINVDGGTVLR